MALSGTNVAKIGPVQNIATRPCDIAAVGPRGETSGEALVVAGDITTTGSAADNALIGAVTETAPTTDTASSGLNGRLQRVAQRITSLIALLPSSLGAKTGANSLSVVLASDSSFVNKPYAASASDWQYAAAASGISNTTTAVTFKAADASLRNYITAIQMAADALGAGTELAIRDGAGGAVLWRTKIGTAGIVNGISITFPTPIKGTAATLLEVVTLTASITGSVYFSAQGFVAA